ncbi:peptidase S51 family protein [Anoxybacillus sp. B7M1]|nr:peptidase S51 family protein [Anoxybacillus sp. B7M1]
MEPDNPLLDLYILKQAKKTTPKICFIPTASGDSDHYIYVGGGNTRNLLVLWKEWGLDNILRKAWNQGIVLAGISAGSICWFEEGVTDSFGE